MRFKLITPLSISLLLAIVASGTLLLSLAASLPSMVAYRQPWLMVICAASLLLIILPAIYRPPLWWLFSAISLLAFASSSFYFAQQSWATYQIQSIQSTKPELVHALGQHFIVGYTDETALLQQIERGWIGGVFITKRNIANLSAQDIRQMTQRWQALRLAQQLPPLIIATDQEGGIVSRMSPPLPYQPALGQLLGDKPNQVAFQYGEVQSLGLRELGINLNFAPVIDLDHGVYNPDDQFSKISRRALGTDPRQVASVAASYCAGLAQNKVSCTLKHFPGLGRVFADTHADSAALDISQTELEASDWIPFRSLMQTAEPPATMLAHIRLTQLDANNTASSSPKIIGMLRNKWHYQGLLISDDLSMAGIREQHGGLEQASLQALNAGVDHLLVAWDPDLFPPLLAQLIQAHTRQQLNASALNASQRRIQHWLKQYAN